MKKKLFFSLITLLFCFASTPFCQNISNFGKTQKDPVLSVDVNQVNVETQFQIDATATVNITNSGDTPLKIHNGIKYPEGNSKGKWDEVFSFELNGNTGGEQGVTSDGIYIYTCAWDGGPGYDFAKYSLEGEFIEGFDIPGVSGIRDLTFDGTYFYGAANGADLYKIDLQNKVLIDVITTGVMVIRHCSYYAAEDCFFVGDWFDLYKIDRDGNVIKNCVSPQNAFGSAIDEITDEKPYLYLFTQTPDCNIIQYDIIEDEYTDFEMDLSSNSIYPSNASAGGAYIGEYHGKICFFGNLQSSPNVIAIYELAQSGWLTIEPFAVNLAPGETKSVELKMDGYWAEEGEFNAIYNVLSYDPNVGSETINVKFNILQPGCDPVSSLYAETIDFTNIELMWVGPGYNSNILIDEDFETVEQWGAPPAGWIDIDADGDQKSWSGFDKSMANWIFPHSGDKVIASFSWAYGQPLTPDNYLITPNVEGASEINYFYAVNSSYPEEHYAVMVSSTGVNVEDFSIVFEETANGTNSPNAKRYYNTSDGNGERAQSEWIERTVDIPEGTKYIAFRHFNSTNNNYILIDDVIVYGLDKTNNNDKSYMSFSIFNANDIKTPIVEGISSTVYTFENMTPGDYCYVVKVVYDDGCVSMPSNVACATVGNPYAVVSGIVTDKEGVPIEDVIVKFDDNQNTTTNSDGSYSINVNEGVYDILFYKSGYYPQTIEDFTVNVEPIELNVTLYSVNDCNPIRNLTLENNGENVITIAWDYPDGYRMSKEDIILEEGFDEWELPAGWSLIDADGDGYNWQFMGVDGYQSPHAISSESFDMFTFTNLTPDNYLITPELIMPGKINYWVSAQDPAMPAEHYAVMVSSTGIETSDFTIIFEETLTAKSKDTDVNMPGAWYERNIDIPEGTKYIAFRHFNTEGQFMLNVDEVKVYSANPIIPENNLLGYNIYLNNDLIANIEDPDIKSYVDYSNYTKCYPVTYCVSAVYDSCESEKICDDVIILSIQDDADIAVYPNPADKLVYVSGINVDLIYIYDNSGKIVGEVRSNVIDVSQYPSGVYLLHIRDIELKVHQLKLIIDR